MHATLVAHACLAVGLTANQVRSEEALLRRSLGAEYDRYAELVPRWIGFRRKTPS